MNFKNIWSAAVLAALFVCLAVWLHPSTIEAFGFLVFGAVTVTYQFPVAGVVAPTAAEAKQTVRGTVTATADGDTDAVITHNFGLSAGELAAGQPEVTLIPLDVGFYTSTWTVAYTDGNTVTLTKGTGAGSGVATAQLGFLVRKPHTIAV